MEYQAFEETLPVVDEYSLFYYLYWKMLKF